ncbi:MAG: hypothetical protein AAGF78_14555 [Pseudomonadota bacterium]
MSAHQRMANARLLALFGGILLVCAVALHLNGTRSSAGGQSVGQSGGQTGFLKGILGSEPAPEVPFTIQNAVANDDITPDTPIMFRLPPEKKRGLSGLMEKKLDASRYVGLPVPAGWAAVTDQDVKEVIPLQLTYHAVEMGEFGTPEAQEILLQMIEKFTREHTTHRLVSMLDPVALLMSPEAAVFNIRMRDFPGELSTESGPLSREDQENIEARFMRQLNNPRYPQGVAVDFEGYRLGFYRQSNNVTPELMLESDAVQLWHVYVQPSYNWGVVIKGLGTLDDLRAILAALPMRR